MTLIAGEAGAWTLLDPDGNRVATGKVGQPVADPRTHVRLQVSSLLARPGTKFGITPVRSAAAFSRRVGEPYR